MYEKKQRALHSTERHETEQSKGGKNEKLAMEERRMREEQVG